MMPSPNPWDYRLERRCESGWLLIEFGEQREISTAYRAVTQQLELIKVVFRIVRPDGTVEVETAG